MQFPCFLVLAPNTEHAILGIRRWALCWVGTEPPAELWALQTKQWQVWGHMYIINTKQRAWSTGKITENLAFDSIFTSQMTENTRARTLWIIIIPVTMLLVTTMWPDCMQPQEKIYIHPGPIYLDYELSRASIASDCASPVSSSRALISLGGVSILQNIYSCRSFAKAKKHFSINKL